MSVVTASSDPPASERPPGTARRSAPDAPTRGAAHGVAAPPRRLAALRGSPLARKIVVFNLLALLVLVAGVLWLNPFRDGLVQQRGAALLGQAELIADVLGGPAPPGGGLSPDAGAVLARLALREGVTLSLHDPQGRLILRRTGDGAADPRPALQAAPGPLPAANGAPPPRFLAAALAGRTQIDLDRAATGNSVFTVVVPVRDGATVLGAVALTSAAGEIDRLARQERERLLQVFILALLVSIGLSLVLASTIANPLSDLAAAAERGRDRNARQLGPGRVRIPDLAARPDEIGRLSVAMRGMVAALYDRIEMNEQFAADVAHEIKNPLASLRSAVGTLRVARREDQRARLLDVIEHDVRRLDRLVSDISNASRLDSELVKEQEARFDLVPTLRNLAHHLARDAEGRGIDFITDLPPGPIPINGLEARLAQVFVNLIVNAVSFCEEGDAVRLWARRRDNRVLVVVEDTGPGIPEAALTKIFKRFYSERPVQQFGNHSGLGLAISRQIVEAHGGVIWAENIHPTAADPGSDPLGARFVVGLPV